MVSPFLKLYLELIGNGPSIIYTLNNYSLLSIDICRDFYSLLVSNVKQFSINNRRHK